MSNRTKTVHVVVVTDKAALRKVLEEFASQEQARQVKLTDGKSDVVKP
ncbi:MAG: hypothetical protein PCFJNLEI_00671 [Verrucomicrobiae bacterium]|nr:hypothetical protein [Verrucomicrobiae bacterium]